MNFYRSTTGSNPRVIADIISKGPGRQLKLGNFKEFATFYKPYTRPSRRMTGVHATSLSRVSSTIHYESAPLIYQYAAFSFHDTVTLGTFFGLMDDTWLHSITTIEWTLKGTRNYVPERLATLKNLRNLTLRFHSALTSEYPRDMSRLFILRYLTAIRGIEVLKLEKIGEHFVHWDGFVEDMQVVKQPRLARVLIAQMNKRFPNKEARTEGDDCVQEGSTC